ncbi:unnamed protein product [Zymoseptoria tritici ST99CH_3D1]|nr:unnamed protein product [Zymoseptoria tritici ST99CH_3D1]
MDAEDQDPKVEDQDPYDWHDLLESRVHALFKIRPGPPVTLTPTHLALTHLLHRHRTRCSSCLGSRHHYQSRPPFFQAVDAMAKLTLTRLGVMSQSRLLKYLDVIARDWMCRRCCRSKTVHTEKRRIALTWVRELRRVVAMLTRIISLNDETAHPEHPVIDLTRTPPPRSHDKAITCVICTDAIPDPAGEKSCFQCNNVIHQSCFDQYWRSEDLHQLPTLDSRTEKDVLHLPCVFCRCIVLSVSRSEEGRKAWEERKRETERLDEEFARRLQREEEQRRRRGNGGEEGVDKENVEPEVEEGEAGGWWDQE